MANSYSGIGVQEKNGLRLADVVTAAENDSVCAFNFDVGAAKQLHDAHRRAGDECLVSKQQRTQILRMKSIHVLARIDAFENPVFVDMFWQRQLDQNAVD